MRNDSRPDAHDSQTTATAFAQRVRQVRDGWEDVEAMRTVAEDHSRSSQLAVLRLLYLWCDEAVNEMREVLGEDVGVVLTPLMDTVEEPLFLVSLEEHHRLRVSLAPRAKGREEWYIDVRFSLPPSAAWIPATPDRKHESWGRANLQEMLLSLLSAYKRARLAPSR